VCGPKPATEERVAKDRNSARANRPERPAKKELNAKPAR
jgi:hypothetical protein